MTISKYRALFVLTVPQSERQIYNICCELYLLVDSICADSLHQVVKGWFEKTIKQCACQTP